MKLRDILPTGEQLKLIQGVERDLLQRKRRGTTFSAIAAVAWAILQILLSFDESGYLKNIGNFFVKLFTGNWRSAATRQM